MAKRQAASQLNHDNWDQEEDSEEAGNFKKATDDELKGRVIKKAKRRNPEERKNVFAGFSGFSTPSSGSSSSNAFGFLSNPKEGLSESTSQNNAFSGFAFGKPDAGKENKPAFGGFVFGNAKPKDEGTKPFGGFVFSSASAGATNGEAKDKVEGTNGVKADEKESEVEPEPEKPSANGSRDHEGNSEDKKVEKEPDLMAKFKKPEGSWSCSVCMISNKKEQTKCAACDSPKPAESTEKPQSEKTEASNTFGGFSGWKKQDGGSWSCSACYVSNKDTDEKCVACTGPKPTKKEKNSSDGKDSSLLEKFKPAEGSWSCSVCMISNEKKADKCMACETPNPNKKAEDPFMAKFKPAASTWSCEVCMISNPADKSKCAACETPKPGSEKEAAASDASSTGASADGEFSFGASGGFKFASTSSSSSTTAASGFNLTGSSTSFGSTGNNSFPGGFKMSGTDEKPAPTSGGFKFGTSEEKPAAETGGFKFGSSEEKKSPAKTCGFSFGSAADKKSPATTSGFVFQSTTKTESVGTGFSLKSSDSATTASDAATSGGFTFGSQTVLAKEKETEQFGAGGFTFGSGNTSASTAQKDNTNAATTEIKFGGFGPGTAGTPLFGTPAGKGGPLSLLASVAAGQFTPESPATSKRRSEYLGHVKNLNKQVNEFIQSKLSKNLLLDLSPVFQDYMKHIGKLKDEYGMHRVVKPQSQASKPESSAETEDENKGDDTEASATDAEASQEEEEMVEGNDEKDAFFTRKCKLFYLKEGEYVSRGVAFLYMKSTEDKKTQLIIRSNNKLKNLLLNVLLSPDMKVDMAGANNVLLGCIPNPPLDTKMGGKQENSPVTFLIKVKTDEDAKLLKEELDRSTKK